MRELDHILTGATSSVEGHYFSLAVENGEDTQLERNYCYELFHQMRGRWPRNCPYTLSAEVDKRRHPLIGQSKGGRVIPNLLVHTPGAMAGNHAIIEIKRAERRRNPQGYRYIDPLHGPGYRLSARHIPGFRRH